MCGMLQEKVIELTNKYLDDRQPLLKRRWGCGVWRDAVRAGAGRE